MQGKYLLNIIYICKNVKISKRLYFTCKNIEYNLITSAFTVHFGFSNLYAVESKNVGIHLLNWIVRGLLAIKLSRYAEFILS